MRRSHDTPAGTLHHLELDSEAAADNRLGDPGRRDVLVYTPFAHDGSGLPLIVDLAAYTSSGPARVAWRNFGENLPERLDRLIATGAMKPAVVAFPDAFTRLGGNQYVNSPIMGRWSDFLAEDLLDAVETSFDCGGPGRRGLVGKSSGGYGAIVNAMLRPDIWSAAACQSGDMGFELMFGADFPRLLRRLAKFDFDIPGFIAAFEKSNRPAGEDIHVLMLLAMAASYDPDPDAPFGVQLPVTMDTCELIEARWSNWLKWDPLKLVETHGEALKGLKALFIDCGESDQYNLLYGARRMNRRLTELGVDHVYEEFAGTHSGIDFRLDTSLPILAEALSE